MDSLGDEEGGRIGNLSSEVHSTTRPRRGLGLIGLSKPRFPSSPLIIRVPCFLLCGFDKGTQKEKGQKGTTGEPRNCMGIMSGVLCGFVRVVPFVFFTSKRPGP